MQKFRRQPQAASAATPAEQALLYTQADDHLWKTIFTLSPEGIVITDAQGKILHVNPAFTRITGYSARECLGKNPSFLKSGLHGTDFYQEMWQHLKKEGRWENEIWDRHRSGESRIQKLAIHAVNNEQGKTTHHIGMFQDASNIQQQRKELAYQTLHDALTTLPNRNFFLEALHAALTSARRNAHKLSVLFLDLDNFRTVNDSLGHHVGDLLLQQVAQRLTSCCRDGETLSRFGGDEFMLLLPKINEDGREALEAAQRILGVLSFPYLIQQHEITCTVSIGITTSPADGDDAATLVKAAEIAMYTAKNQGKNRYNVYTKAMSALALERMELDSNLRKALRQHEFKLYYQPQVNIATGKISGVEALLRWQRSESELIPPDKFIPFAEETGLIVPLGEWALRQACQQTKIWHNAGFDHLTVSVNLSARQFQDERLIDVVKEALQAVRLAPRFLFLEITESTVMQDINLAIKIMSALKKLGTHLSIDDFGTGYSSLSYLKNFPLREIKIDKSFVREIPAQADDIAITKAILSLAHNLHLRVLAEGIENAEQLDFMRKYRCDTMQGFLFSKPVLPEEIFNFLISGKTL